MKRKATRFLALAMSAVLVTSLTACGDGSDENAKDAVTPVEAQPMLSELELRFSIWRQNIIKESLPRRII